MPTIAVASNRFANYYMDLAKRNIARAELVDIEFAQIQKVFNWLSNHHDARYLQLLTNLSSYFQIRSLHNVLLDYCLRGLSLSNELDIDAGRLLILTSDAYFSLGEWEKALECVRRALAASTNSSPATYAQATLALGRLQINQGNYRMGLETLENAEALLSTRSDVEGVAAAKSEVAAYFLVKGDYPRALNLYLEIDDMLQQHSIQSTHTAFMLGVVYRRLKQYPEALRQLNDVLDHARSQNNPGEMATALHHLAWIYYDQGKWEDAIQFGTQAKRIYREIRSPRGESDADEQLGLIAFQQKDCEIAIAYLEQALSTRLRIGNRPGAASTLRRLARVHLQRGNIVNGFRYFFRSFILYYRMNMLSRQRIGRIFKSLFGSQM